MSRELAYLLLICGLMVVPGLLQRLAHAAAAELLPARRGRDPRAAGWARHDDAVHLLAALGISTLFLYAGLEVDLATLRRALGPLSVYLLIRMLSIAIVAWLGWRYLDLRWQDATLLALALLTSSTGFIIDSLDRFGLATEERFWVTNNAISAELLALAIMFVVLKANDPGELARATLALSVTLVALPLALVALGRWIVPYAAGSAFSLLIMVGFAAAFVTDAIGVEYLLGAFLAGLVARLLRDPRAGTGITGQPARGETVFVVLPAVLFLCARRQCAGRCAQRAGAGHRARLDGGAGAAAWIRGLGQAALAGQCGDTRSSLRVAAALTPTLIFTLVLATILRERGAISDELFGGLLLYAGLNTLLPSFVLRASFDVAPSPLEAARQIGARDADSATPRRLRRLPCAIRR